MDIHFLAMVAGAYLAAGFVKGVIGMGLPTVAIGLLGLMMTPQQAAAILLLPSLVTNVWQGLSGGGSCELLRRLWPMFAGICIGTLGGALLLPHGGGGRATTWLGLVLVVYSALGLFKVHFFVPPRAEGWIGLAVGIANGIVAVATGVFAMPSMPFIQALHLPRDRLVQALGLSFTLSTVMLAPVLYHAGEMSLSLASPALLALAAALIGMPLGRRVRGKISPETFRLCLYIGLLVLGARLALRGLI